MSKPASREESVAENVYTAEQYNSVVQSAQLTQVLLLRSSFQVSERWYDPKAERKLEISLSDSRVRFSPAADTVAGEFDWLVCARDPGGAELLSLTATFAALYGGLDSNQSKAAISEFIARVGQFAAYPYMRTFVGQMSWLSAANLPVLPILRSGP